MKRRLPPLNAVRAFEAAARHNSFTLAADELAVTPTAISHQIRHLENILSLKLFERSGRKIVLTEHGASILPKVTSGFDSLADAFEQVYAEADTTNVSLSVTRAFARYWLQPRLNKFYERYPLYTLTVHASENCVDLHSNEADIAIRYGARPTSENDGLYLFEDEYVPVVQSNALVSKRKSPTINDIEPKRLLDVRWTNPALDAPSWQAWFNKNNYLGYERFGCSSYDEYNLAHDALRRGHGAALISTVILETAEKQENLISLDGERLAGQAYRIIFSARGQRKRAARSFAEWLLDEASCYGKD